MIFHIISSIANGAGLERDYVLLKHFLELNGHHVVGVQYDSFKPLDQNDVNLFLEVIHPYWFRYATRNWFVPNPEWFDPSLWQFIGRMDAILCKTSHAKGLFSNRGVAVHHTGFESRDICDLSVRREKRFLHVAGKSRTKNTLAIVNAWIKFNIQRPLTLVCSQPEKIGLPTLPNNVTLIRKASEDEIKWLMNAHLFHLCPSAYEGWGHYIHEAQSCRAVIVTTDAPPMNEFGCPSKLLVRPSGYHKQGIARCAMVDPDAIATAVQRCDSLTHSEIVAMGIMARERFIRNRNIFRSQFTSLIRQELCIA